jgi:hypothetical protein
MTVELLAAAILIFAAVAALIFRSRRLEVQIRRALTRFDAVNEERRRHAQPQRKPYEPERLIRDLQGQLDSLRSMIARIPGDTARQIEAILPEWSPEQEVPPPPRLSIPDDRLEPQDGLTQLLAIANHIVQQSSTTLDDFRASAGTLVTHVAAWPGSADCAPLAFIVEYGGAHYAVPNVIKPARLPNDWFNRGDFGVNDEIQRVLSLPRLRRHADGYDVQEAGVFGR